MRREWIEMFGIQDANKRPMSPSMRREWIEIGILINYKNRTGVSLHAEGVD